MKFKFSVGRVFQTNFNLEKIQEGEKRLRVTWENIP